MFDLNGKVALVTGSSAGLGAAIARCMADAGADVAVNYVSPSSAEKAERQAAYIRSKGRRAAVIQADVASEADVRRMTSISPEDFSAANTPCR